MDRTKLEIADAINRIAASVIIQLIADSNIEVNQAEEIDWDDKPVHIGVGCSDVITVSGETIDACETTSRKTVVSLCFSGDSMHAIIWDSDSNIDIITHDAIMNHVNISVESKSTHSPIEILENIHKYMKKPLGKYYHILNAMDNT